MIINNSTNVVGLIDSLVCFISLKSSSLPVSGGPSGKFEENLPLISATKVSSSF